MRTDLSLTTSYKAEDASTAGPVHPLGLGLYLNVGVFQVTAVMQSMHPTSSDVTAGVLPSLSSIPMHSGYDRWQGLTKLLSISWVTGPRGAGLWHMLLLDSCSFCARDRRRTPPQLHLAGRRKNHHFARCRLVDLRARKLVAPTLLGPGVAFRRYACDV